jgi:hypothetical protein
MLAADRLLLETNLKQSAIKLREKELNLYCENFSSVGTQAAVMAGFTTTCFIEVSIPDTTHFIVKGVLHLFAVLSICFNLTCVSLSTITSVWGSTMALRGKDGSMDEAVNGMNSERNTIFKSFFFGLFFNLLTVIAACWILMDSFMAVVATAVVIYSMGMIHYHATRIQTRFYLSDAVELEDLTQYPTTHVFDKPSQHGTGVLSYIKGKSAKESV